MHFAQRESRSVTRERDKQNKPVCVYNLFKQFERCLSSSHHQLFVMSQEVKHTTLLMPKMKVLGILIQIESASTYCVLLQVPFISDS